MASEGFERRERKEAVVTVDDEAMKDCWSQIEASNSGDGEFVKMSKRGSQASILFF